MKPADPQSTMLPGGMEVLGREVGLREIDRELRRLWEADEARTNASLMNLVVYSAKPGALVENSAVMGELTREHACRAILVGLDRSHAEVSTRAWITAHCHLAGGRKAVCCEQIAFALTGRSTGRLRNIVFAHLNSDLPLVFWWQGELSGIFTESLYRVIDRLVIDSSEWSNPAVSWARIADAVRDGGDRLVVQDLEWTRGYPWRLALASLFDDPRAAAGLHGISKVRIVHRAGHRCAALLMLAWMTVQAGWRRGTELRLEVPRQSPGREGFSFEHPDGTPVLAVVEEGTGGPALHDIELQGASLRAGLHARSGDPHLRAVRETDSGRLESLLPAGPESACGLVGDLLARGGRNTLLGKVLPTFLRLLDG